MPTHITNEYWGTGGITPHILKLGARKNLRGHHHTPAALSPGKRTQGLTEWGAGWAPESVFTYGRREKKYFASVGIRTPHRPGRSLDRPEFGAVKE